jgi:phosphoglycerate dehydrogenase-like enzyme
VNEPALLDALHAGRLAAASLDVFATEPLPVDHPLWTAPGVIVSPHLSGDSAGWLDALADQFVDNALRFLDGSPLANVVDKRLGFVPTDPSPGDEERP